MTDRPNCCKKTFQSIQKKSKTPPAPQIDHQRNFIQSNLRWTAKDIDKNINLYDKLEATIDKFETGMRQMIINQVTKQKQYEVKQAVKRQQHEEQQAIKR